MRQRRLTAADELTYPREFEHITLARTLIARHAVAGDLGALEAALGLLDRLLGAAGAGGRNGSAIEILVLQAVALQARGDLPDATAALRDALARAEPEGYVRIFLHAGPAVPALLASVVTQDPADGHGRRVLAALEATAGPPPPPPAPSASPLVDPLSARELDVLRLLRSDLSAGSKGDPTLTASELFIYPMPLIATMAIVAGILLFTGEAQHGTLAGALTARPARWVLVTAKTTTAIVVGLTLGVNAMVAGFIGSVAGGLPVGDASTMVTRVLWALAYVASAAVIGLGVGMIVRHSAGAISGLLMWAFVIESLFAPSLPDGVLHALPFSAGYRLLDAGANFEPPVVIAEELARYQYALIFGGYALVALVVGTVLLYRRDTN